MPRERPGRPQRMRGQGKLYVDAKLCASVRYDLKRVPYYVDVSSFDGPGRVEGIPDTSGKLRAISGSELPPFVESKVVLLQLEDGRGIEVKAEEFIWPDRWHVRAVSDFIPRDKLTAQG